MRRILITGGSGFLGVPCVRAAAATAAHVHAVSRSRPGDAHDLPFHSVDLFDDRSVAALMDELRPTDLLHLAWIVTPGVYRESPENERWVEASLALLAAFARHGGKRAVLAGSSAEYDWTVPGPYREYETPMRPASLYGRCKNRLRQEAERLALSAGLSLGWGRLFFLYGPREPRSKLVPSIALNLLAGLPAACTDGWQKRDFLHVEDAARALVALLESDVTGPVNIGSGQATAICEVARAVADVVGRPDLLRLGGKSMDATPASEVVADIGRLSRVGWAPRWPLSRGLADTVAWWKEQHVDRA